MKNLIKEYEVVNNINGIEVSLRLIDCSKELLESLHLGKTLDEVYAKFIEDGIKNIEFNVKKEVDGLGRDLTREYMLKETVDSMRADYENEIETLNKLWDKKLKDQIAKDAEIAERKLREYKENNENDALSNNKELQKKVEELEKAIECMQM
jgi:hypothetical protein